MLFTWGCIDFSVTLIFSSFEGIVKSILFFIFVGAVSQNSGPGYETTFTSAIKSSNTVKSKLSSASVGPELLRMGLNILV